MNRIESGSEQSFSTETELGTSRVDQSGWWEHKRGQPITWFLSGSFVWSFCIDVAALCQSRFRVEEDSYSVPGAMYHPPSPSG